MRSAADSSPRIMLSGFNSDSEKTQMAKIIQRMKGTYCSDPSNSRAYVFSCTHVLCKKPSRSEKYLAACAAGKWILKHSYIEECVRRNQWVPEEDYEWGADILQQFPRPLQQAPRRWRERIAVRQGDRPFFGWKVGLVMTVGFVKAYTRILEAGGGEAVDITSRFAVDINSSTSSKLHGQTLLTHVFVTPKFASRIPKSKTEDIPYLRAEFLAMYLLSDPPPNQEDFSLFRARVPELSSPDPTKSSPRKATPPKRVKEKVPDSQPSAKLMVSPSLPSPSVQENLKPSATDTSSSKEQTGSPTKKEKTTSNKPLPASVFAKSAVVFSATKKTKDDGISAKPFSQKSTFKPLVQQSVKLSTARQSQVSSVKDKAATSADKPNVVQSPKRLVSQADVPTISLGPKRSTQDVAPSERQPTSNAGAKTPKRHFSEDFFRRNHVVLEEFALRKKQMLTSYGVLEELVNTDNDIDFPESYRNRNAKPFSREVMRDLEAGLEFNYRSEHFLKEISNRLNSSEYPPPDLIFVVMKVILLDSTDKNLSDSAHSLLDKILELHPPQAPDIKTEKLYHKALTSATTPDTDETSLLMVAVGDMLSRFNAEDWRFWCSRDPTLGTLWTFYSRVFNIAIKPSAQTYDEIGVKQELPSEEKVENAGLLAEFLTTLVVKDYQEVLLRRNYPAHSPMIKCLLADLLWPTMTGLEPWFRRPSANLADLISLYVRAVEAYIYHVNADIPDDESVESNSSSGSVYDRLGCSRRVLEELARLVSVTTSWCIHCDLRDKERGKRTSSRTLESELVSVLRAELENKTMEVLEEALFHLPPRLKLKVNVALIHISCSNVLVRDKTSKTSDELSLETITSISMQMVPSLLQGEEKDTHFSREQTASSLEKKTDFQTSSGKANQYRIYGDRINRRNHKGETPLHVACMSNRDDIVRRLLAQPGIDPNAIDYAGWTALGEACNHGSIDCVRALLTLPVKSEVQGEEEPCTGNSRPALEIDLTLCPMEGQTPLHDALGNDHLEIACLLIRKGGVALLDKVDSEDRTPLHYCVSEAARSSMIEYACKIAVKARRRRLKAAGEHSNQELMTLAKIEQYDRVLPRKSVLLSEEWRKRVRWLHQAVLLLLSNYITSGDLVNACMSLDLENDEEQSTPKPNSPRSHGDVTKIDDVSRTTGQKTSMFSVHTAGFSGTDLERYANDVMYCLRWKECWDTYTVHISRLLGDNEEAKADVMADTVNPVPIDIITIMPDR